MGKKVGRNAKVTIGTDTVVGMGTWSMPGVSTEEFDVSDFQDTWKTYLYGMKDGGTISFSGWHDPADTTGQNVLFAANAKNSALDSLRFYVDDTSYFVPNQTTDYLGPGDNSTGMDTPGVCSVNITGLSIDYDKSGVGRIAFTARINGCMAFV